MEQYKKLVGTQIEALTREHGAEIVEFYKKNGFDVQSYRGGVNKHDNDYARYYGVCKNGDFRNRYIDSGLKTITLDEAETLVAENLYTEITAYKLKDGSIVESKEQSENKAKEMKIKNDLHKHLESRLAILVFANLETIKKIINQ